MADVGLPAGRRVPLVEDQVDDRQHGGEPAGEQVISGHLAGGRALLDLLRGARQPLRHGGLGDQERPGDSAAAEDAGGPQRQGDLLLSRQRRVAAREDVP
jgi:hypothetical protein